LIHFYKRKNRVIMVLEIDVNPDSVMKLEKFLGTGKYRELAQSTQSFSRKLNEERKMRIPYVDGQTGVAQKHYNNFKKSKERMPGCGEGQIYSYPQRRWLKKRYQYLQYFMLPKHLRFEATERLAAQGLGTQQGQEERSEEQSDKGKTNEWGDYYMNDDEYAMAEPGSEPESDSDFEDYGRPRGKGKGRKTGGKGRSSAVGGRGRDRDKRGRDQDMDRPTPSERSSRSSRRSSVAPAPPEIAPSPVRHHPVGPPVSLPPGPPHLPPGYPHPGPHPGMGGPHHPPGYPPHHRPEQLLHHQPQQQQPPPPPVRKAEPSGYCDFCLGDADNNKKTGEPEELIGCAECGRSGHPTCLQFTKNMKMSVKKYPWQCIECKTCTLCGTSENDDKLLFCDDCDRGYHMYCLVPPMKTAPEGNWSCSICVNTFHK